MRCFLSVLSRESYDTHACLVLGRAATEINLVRSSRDELLSGQTDVQASSTVPEVSIPGGVNPAALRKVSQPGVGLSGVKSSTIGHVSKHGPRSIACVRV